MGVRELIGVVHSSEELLEHAAVDDRLAGHRVGEDVRRSSAKDDFDDLARIVGEDGDLLGPRALHVGSRSIALDGARLRARTEEWNLSGGVALAGAAKPTRRNPRSLGKQSAHRLTRQAASLERIEPRPEG
jgi:hypothetical protein